MKCGIMESHIDPKKEILSQLDLKELFKAEAENFTEVGEDFAKTNCPYCEDASKFYINTKTGSFNCLNCDKNGSFMDFFMKRHEVNYEDALKILTALPSTESSEDTETDIQGETNITEEEVRAEENADVQPSKPESIQKGIYLKPEIYESYAFLSLGRNAIKILIAMIDYNQTEMTDEIKLSYGVLEEIYKIGRSSIPKAINELKEKGFIDITHRGGSGQKDKNEYRLIDDYLNWEPIRRENQLGSKIRRLDKPANVQESEIYSDQNNTLRQQMG